jgi:hypothetical protein
VVREGERGKRRIFDKTLCSRFSLRKYKGCGRLKGRRSIVIRAKEEVQGRTLREYEDLLLNLIFGVSIFGIIGCSIKTPEIRGVVLDEETKQPVEEAWITATLGIKTKTVGGDIHKYLSVEMPHTRTDKSGRFIIPPKRFKKPSFPIGFGTDVETFGVGASTVDDRGGSLNLMEFLGRRKADVTIYIKPDHTKDTEGEYFTYLQGLYNYCLTGRFYVEVPPAEGGCDKWELNYAIAKHERYLERYRDSIEKEVNTVIFGRLSYLYEKKGDFNKAIETLKKSIALIERRGLLKFEMWQRNKKEIEWKINELQKKLEGVKK